MDPDYYQQHWAHIRIIRRNRELINRIQQQQHPVQPQPPQDVPAVPQPPPPPIVVPPPPPAIQQDLAHLPQVLQAAQLHTPDIQDAQEQVPHIVQPPPPPVKINPRNLPTPPEVKRTNLSDSLSLEEEEEVIVPVIFQDDPIMASTSNPAIVPAAMDKTPPIPPDVWPPPSAASTPASGVETIHDSPDSFHSLSDQDSSTILHTPDNVPPQSSLATAKKNKSSTSVVQLFQEFQGAAHQVALKITKPQDPPVPRDPEVLSPCPKHGTVVNFSLSNLQELNQRKCTCPTEPGPTELPPTRNPDSTLPPLPLQEQPRPNTRNRGVPQGHYNPITQVFKRKSK